jgi:hypothetical protein
MAHHLVENRWSRPIVGGPLRCIHVESRGIVPQFRRVIHRDQKFLSRRVVAGDGVKDRFELILRGDREN